MKTLGIILCLVLGISSHAFSQILTIETSQNGVTSNPWTLPQSILAWNSAADAWELASSDTPYTYTIQNGPSITLDNLEFSDPTISYGFTISSNSAASTFSFSFSLPGAIAAGPTTVSATLNGGVTAGTLSPVSVSLPIQQGFIDATDAGVDLGTSNFTGVINLSAGPIPGPTGGASAISVGTNFGLTANGSATLAGTFTVDDMNSTATPEPSTYALLILGAGVLFLAVRRRQVR